VTTKELIESSAQTPAKLEQHCGGALEHYSITVLHCNTLFFKGIRTLTRCPGIRDREPSSAPVHKERQGEIVGLMDHIAIDA
jgi:hypothetical protein